MWQSGSAQLSIVWRLWALCLWEGCRGLSTELESSIARGPNCSSWWCVCWGLCVYQTLLVPTTMTQRALTWDVLILYECWKLQGDVANWNLTGLQMVYQFLSVSLFSPIFFFSLSLSSFLLSSLLLSFCHITFLSSAKTQFTARLMCSPGTIDSVSPQTLN